MGADSQLSWQPFVAHIPTSNANRHASRTHAVLNRSAMDPDGHSSCAVPLQAGARSGKVLARAELRAALAGTGLAACYQPVVRLRDRHAVSLEVLARLDHPRYGMLSPDQFVPQMEDAGLARRLTESVAALAFDDHALYLAQLGLTIALNFPLDVLLDAAALAALDKRREAAGIPATRLLIELTESRPLDAGDAGEMRAFGAAVRHLRDLGYGLAIDDLGPETANLPALLGCGLTALKLDRSIVEASATAPRAARFIGETVEVARTAGLTVIAEGVADGAGWHRMCDFGVDQAQGYFISPPLYAPRVSAWLEEWRHPGD